MNSDLDKISSWTSYKPLQKWSNKIDEGDHLHSIEEVLELKQKAEEADSDNMICAHHLNGVEALQQSIPLSEDKVAKINFQWIRPHPSLLLQVSAKTSSSSSCKESVQASSIVNGFVRNESRKSPRDSCTISFPTSNVVLPMNNVVDSVDSFFCPPKVNVDLTKLFDPILHSEWLPGQNVLSTYDDEGAQEQVKACNIDETESDNITVIDKLQVKEDFKIFLASITHEEEKDSLGGQIHVPELKKDLMLLNTMDWMKILPSHEFKSVLCGGKRLFIAEGVVTLFHKVTTKLLSICSSKPLGLHITAVLIPVVFDAYNEGFPNNNEAAKLREIAMLLVRRCGLGRLSKAELLDLTKDIAMNGIGIEFKRSIADEFFDYNI